MDFYKLLKILIIKISARLMHNQFVKGTTIDQPQPKTPSGDKRNIQNEK
jgi:hypothetical protein